MSVEVVLARSDSFFVNAPFDWDGRLFTTVADFEYYLANPSVRATLDAWANRITVHHTYIPTVQQWLNAGGRASLMGMIRHWRDTNGWTTGPNMVIAPEGIYLASGVDGPGIHATVCNGDGVGIEVVGDYDKGYWQEPIRSFVFGAVVALARAMRMTPTTVVDKKLVNGHRECNSPKSCPGKVIDLYKVRRDVALLIPITPATDITVIGVQPSITEAQFLKYLQRYGAPLPAGEMERVYTFCAWLDLDPAFLAALWKQEAFTDDPTDNKPGVAIIGGSELQRQSHSPINIAENDTVRDTVEYNGRKWRKWNTWQYGLYDAALHLKQYHGDRGRVTVRTIVPVHSPASDGNPVAKIIENIFTRMAEMRTL